MKPRLLPDLIALMALTAICALVFWPLLSGQTYYFGDVQVQFHPWAVFWADAMEGGRVPLWNPHILGGAPFVGNPQIWIFYPSSLLLLLLSPVAAIALSTWLHLWLGGALFYAWLRRANFDLPPLPALLGACVWMLCGFFVAKTQFLNMLQSLAWVPAILWASQALAARPNARATLILGALLALQLLAGHAQISAFSIYMLAIYAFWQWRQTPRRASGWRVTASVTVALCVAAMLACGQLLPVFEALGATQRQSLSLFEASRFVTVPWALITLVLPYYYGNPMTGDWHYPMRVNFWESVCYIGIAPLFLGGLALWKTRQARFWALWSAGFLWLSMGVFGGLWVIAFAVLPGLSRFHDAGRFGVGFAIGGAVLAALGARELNRKHWRLAALALLLTVFDLGIFARGIYPFRPNDQAQTPPPALWGTDALLESHQARLWQPDYGEVWGALQPPFDYRLNNPANTRAFFEAAPSNRHMMALWLAEAGYDPLKDRATLRRVAAFGLSETDRDGAPATVPPDFAARLGRSSIRILQIFRAAPLPAVPSLTLVYRSSWTSNGRRLYIYRNEQCLPRARWHGGNGNWQLARIARETTSDIALEVPARATTIELADSMRPGWHAFAGDHELPIATTIEGWRRVELPLESKPQARTIRFVYAPTNWKLGVFISLCALGFVSAGLMATRNGKDRELSKSEVEMIAEQSAS